MKIEMKGINKAFGSNQVLKDAGFVLEDGEVHALMGENGAGKSTLMKILTGVYTRDTGTVIVDGKEVVYKSPQEAEKAGIVFIYQELNVLFDLTVEENLFMGKEITKGFGICDKSAINAPYSPIYEVQLFLLVGAATAAVLFAITKYLLLPMSLLFPDLLL